MEKQIIEGGGRWKIGKRRKRITTVSFDSSNFLRLRKPQPLLYYATSWVNNKWRRRRWNARRPRVLKYLRYLVPMYRFPPRRNILVAGTFCRARSKSFYWNDFNGTARAKERGGALHSRESLGSRCRVARKAWKAVLKASKHVSPCRASIFW